MSLRSRAKFPDVPMSACTRFITCACGGFARDSGSRGIWMWRKNGVKRIFASSGLGQTWRPGVKLQFGRGCHFRYIRRRRGHVFKATPASRPSKRGGAMTNHQFFIRLAEAMIAEIGKMTSDGALFRIDLRLRA